MHDIGKVGIRDNILLKPEKLTPEEFETIKRHASFGEDVITQLIEKSGPTEFLTIAKEIAGGHHEKWNGSGYPRGLKEEEIPLCARIMVIADVYDALVSKLIYKPSFSHEEALKILKEGKGNHFDPTLIEAFFEIEAEFNAIAQQYKD